MSDGESSMTDRPTTCLATTAEEMTSASSVDSVAQIREEEVDSVRSASFAAETTTVETATSPVTPTGHSSVTLSTSTNDGAHPPSLMTETSTPTLPTTPSPAATMIRFASKPSILTSGDEAQEKAEVPTFWKRLCWIRFRITQDRLVVGFVVITIIGALFLAIFGIYYTQDLVPDSNDTDSNENDDDDGDRTYHFAHPKAAHAMLYTSLGLLGPLLLMLGLGVVWVVLMGAGLVLVGLIAPFIAIGEAVAKAREGHREDERRKKEMFEIVGLA
jgi:hypothetical protein